MGEIKKEPKEVPEQEVKGTLLNKIYHFLKKDEQKELLSFAYSNGISVSVIVILIWQFLKMVYYIFMRGKFSVYGIDSSNLFLLEENIGFQIIKIFGIGIFVYISNYIVYILLTREIKHVNVVKKILFTFGKLIKLLAWLFFIVLIIIFFAALMLEISIIDLVKDIKYNPIDCIYVVLVTFVFTLIINLFGIEYGVIKITKGKKCSRRILYKEYKKYKRNKSVNKTKLKKHGYIISEADSVNETKKTYNIFILNIVLPVAAIITSLFIIWNVGVDIARKQTEYKVVFEHLEEPDIKNYILHDGKDKFICHPIVFETEENYYLSRLVKRETNYSLDYTYQKVIKKDGIQVYYVHDVSNIELVHTIYKNR